MYGRQSAASKASTIKKPTGHTNSTLTGGVGRKKIEGYDSGMSRPDPLSRMGESGGHLRASQIGSNFTQNVERLKNQGSKQVEEEYIKALQEEIKILEYQMKILKDKEIEQQAAVSQIDKFFSDGVPLNPNILALKSQYQNKKAEDERTLDRMRKEANNYDKAALDLEDEIKFHQTMKDRLEKEKVSAEEEMQKVVDEYSIVYQALNATYTTKSTPKMKSKNR
jgi:hypothetical protein